MRIVFEPERFRFLAILIALVGCIVVGAQARAQAISEDVESFETLPPVLTHSPYDTLKTMQNLRNALIASYQRYRINRSAHEYERLNLISSALISLLNLSQENLASRRDASVRTALALLDIIGEVDEADLASLPDREAVQTDDETTFPVPGTPLLVQRVSEGPREGEFLFSANSTTIAPRFLREIATQSPERLDQLWSMRFLQLSGPLVPVLSDGSLPSFMRDIVWGTPLWKSVFAVVSVFIAIGILLGWRSFLRNKTAQGKLQASTRGLLLSGATLVVVLVMNKYFNEQLFLTGSAALTETFLATIAIYCALAWTFWCFMSFLSDLLAERKDGPVRHIEESMMRLLNHIIALIGAVWILAYGAQTLGLPLLSLLAGLGVGGLAVALAIRPTLENLISGFVIYMEKAVKVGDYCSFAGQEGTVESIGVRSTHIRGLDRTTIAIPNSKFVDMELMNWARCDEMLIRTTIGLRYETDTDQLRYVLAKIRAMMHGHPRITTETARVRFIGYGESSLNLDVRVYAQTREWNDFYAIQEDVFFRIKEIVEASGTAFAFPSQRLYVSRDEGLDKETSKRASAEVGRWRRKRELPFPNFSAKERERLEESLRYPPPGSPEFNGPDEELIAVEERLSADEAPADASPSDDETPAENTSEEDKKPD
ncbi:mechanosensitive ion channel family protein [uncultured Roseibium sp.]|uniref:mechanosensitive ion channel family protein n=1 Tax=uncultured Roseibium sp. TaxID=1936171 RepID=UPI002622BD93|nr:mechanosensitive ion channel family protein [uncultured Roseibium sp.]